MFDLTRISKVLVIIMLLVSASCVGYRMGGKPTSGVYHRVKEGDTLSRIARAYKINVAVLATANHLNEGAAIEAGQVLFIPEARQVVEDVSSHLHGMAGDEAFRKETDQRRKKEPLKKDKSDQPKINEAGSTELAIEESPRGVRERARPVPEQAPIIPSEPDRKNFPSRTSPLPGRDDNKEDGSGLKLFIWPVTGKVVSRFGAQPNGMYFNGIKIAAPEGTPVVAAADGTVIFSASLKDYGETVILKHEGDYATVYSYLGQRSVKRSDRLKRGDSIAVIPKPENKGNALIYFEVRHKNQARNPLFFLP